MRTTDELTLNMRVNYLQSPDQNNSSGRYIKSPISSLSLTSSAPRPATQRQQLSKLPSPAAPSFLTLPGEIRNAIYEIILVRNSPIDVDRSGLMISRPHAHHSLDVSLLSTSQQIHHEASGILYSCNVFFVNSTHPRHMDALIRRASRWLYDIGRQATLVRRLLIDVHQPCLWPAELNLLPLLRHVWKRGMDIQEIGFVKIASHSSHDNRNILKVNDKCIRSDPFNHVLRLLSVDDILDVKKYGRFSRMLRRVLIHVGGMNGSIEFYSPSSNEVHILPRRDFRVALNGEFHITGNDPVRPNIDYIMSSRLLADKIMRLIVPSFDNITFDVTNRRLAPPLPAVLAVSQMFRACSSRWLMTNTFNMKMTSNTLKLSVSKALERLENCPWTDVKLGWSKPRDQKEMILRYEMDKPSLLDDIRFDATALIKGTACYTVYTTVRIELACSTDQQIKECHITLTLDEIRFNMITVLHDLTKRYPERSASECPTIWMNGRGKVQEADFRAGTPHTEIVAIDNNSTTQSSVETSAKKKYVVIESSLGYSSTSLAGFMQNLAKARERATREYGDLNLDANFLRRDRISTKFLKAPPTQGWDI
ncbi:Nn.00g011560.m01.CDS01 [Neocucurbitaria sp. VM-36]